MYVASWEKKSEKEYNNIGCIVCDLIIRMTLMVKRDYIKNLWLYIYIYEMGSSHTWCNFTKVTHFIDH